MREVISIHIGQAGVQMGNACWFDLSLNTVLRASRAYKMLKQFNILK